MSNLVEETKAGLYKVITFVENGITQVKTIEIPWFRSHQFYAGLTVSFIVLELIHLIFFHSL